jgi:hypothetical protein
MSMHYFTFIVVKIKSTIRIEVITKEINSLYGTNTKIKKIRWIKSRNTIIVLIYHRHILLDL